MGLGMQTLILMLVQEALYSFSHLPIPTEAFLRVYRMQCSVYYNWVFPQIIDNLA